MSAKKSNLKLLNTPFEYTYRHAFYYYNMLKFEISSCSWTYKYTVTYNIVTKPHPPESPGIFRKISRHRRSFSVDGIHLEQTKIFGFFHSSLSSSGSFTQRRGVIDTTKTSSHEGEDNTSQANPESPAYDGSPAFIPFKGNPALEVKALEGLVDNSYLRPVSVVQAKSLFSLIFLALRFAVSAPPLLWSFLLYPDLFFSSFLAHGGICHLYSWAREPPRKWTRMWDGRRLGRRWKNAKLVGSCGGWWKRMIATATPVAILPSRIYIFIFVAKIFLHVLSRPRSSLACVPLRIHISDFANVLLWIEITASKLDKTRAPSSWHV